MRVPIHVTYTRRKSQTVPRVLGVAAGLILGTALLYLFVSTLLLSSVRVASVSMEPTVSARDRLLVAPVVYGARIPLTAARVPGFRTPGRGEIILLEAPQSAGKSRAARSLDSLVRFFTLQYGSSYPDEDSGGVSRLLVKRVVGLPGDTIRLQGYVAWVKPAGSSEFVAEQTLAARPYEPAAGSAGDLPEETPFGGWSAETVLGEGEYYVLGDNRADSSDSRSWGAVRMERIIGPIVLRYFPFGRMGRV